MKPAIYGITEREIFRLVTGYVAIRDADIRAEFLRSIESWAHEQWWELDKEE